MKEEEESEDICVRAMYNDGRHCDCWYDGYDCCSCGESSPVEKEKGEE